MARQRRLQTLVSNLRGPQEPVRLGAAPVARIVPSSIDETGNLTVHFVRPLLRRRPYRHRRGRPGSRL
jgi:hypothetical protein